MSGIKNDVLVGKNADFSQAGAPNPQSSENNGLVTDGKLWIGSTALNVGGTHINVGSVISPLGTLTIGYSSPNITIDLAGGSSAIDSIGVDTTTGAGTNPVLPTAAGLVTFTGGQYATGTFGTRVITLNSTAANTVAVDVQIGGSNATSLITKNGVCHHSSSQFGVDANGFVTLAAAVPTSFVTDSGTATPSANAITFNAVSQAGSSVLFKGSGSTVSFNVTDANYNSIMGLTAGNGSITGLHNTGFGFGVLKAATSAAQNCAIGENALTSATSASENTAIGYGSTYQLTNGSYNCCLGHFSGQNYTTSSESSNICINNAGTAAESNTIRIGAGTGTGNQQVNKCFIYGITGVTPANIQPVGINSSTGQLGVIPTVATNAGTSAAPTGTASTTYVMLGLGGSWKLTPTTFTSARITINGQLVNGTTGNGINVIMAYGTGTAPVNGAALTGSTVGINTIFTALTGLLTNGVPFSKTYIVTGLTPATAYWFDLQFKAVTGGTASVLNAEFTAQELVS